MTPAETIRYVDATMPRLCKDALQRAGFQLAGYIEKYTDEQGPAKYPSSSPRWGAQSGTAHRSFVPGQPGNLMRHASSGNRYSLEWGTDVPYVRFLETGTSRMKARPALTPAFADFEKTGMVKLLDSILHDIANVFNK